MISLPILCEKISKKGSVGKAGSYFQKPKSKKKKMCKFLCQKLTFAYEVLQISLQNKAKN